MSDRDLLIFGCMVTFIAIGGAYVYMRQSFLEHAGTLRERWGSRGTRRSRRRAA